MHFEHDNPDFSVIVLREKKKKKPPTPKSKGITYSGEKKILKKKTFLFSSFLYCALTVFLKKESGIISRPSQQMLMIFLLNIEWIYICSLFSNVPV